MDQTSKLFKNFAKDEDMYAWWGRKNDGFEVQTKFIFRSYVTQARFAEGLEAPVYRSVVKYADASMLRFAMCKISSRALALCWKQK